MCVVRTCEMHVDPAHSFGASNPFFGATKSKLSERLCYGFLLSCILSIFAPAMGFLCLLCRRLRCDILLVAILS